MGALSDTIVGAIDSFLRTLFSPVTKLIEEQGGDILKLILDTPTPDAVFEAPTNAPWPGLYDYYWDSWLPIILFLWAAMIGLVIFFESTSHLFGSYHRSKLKRRAFSGLLGILAWWWIAALSLRFVDALTVVILPSLADLSLFQTLSFSAMGTLGLVVSLSVDFILFFLIGLIYTVRQVVLYLFVLLMPLLIVFWIPGVGPFTLVSRFMQRLAGFYVPFLFMTVPVALLFRLGAILGESFGLSVQGFGLWILALIIPLVAVLSPIVLVWQAGALFFVADRAMSHTSRHRARGRAASITQRGRETKQGGQNFARGLRGEPAARPDGQAVFNSGDSRAHAAGSRMRSTASGLRSAVVSDDGGGAGDGGSASAGGNQQPSSSDEGDSASVEGGRSSDFENLSDRHRATNQSDRTETTEQSDRRDDDPRYIY